MKKIAHPWLAFTALAMLILAPLLLPGYILALDMPWTPHLPQPTAGNSSWLFYTLLGWLGVVIPSMVLQKLLLLAIFITAGTGAYRLVEDRAGQWPAYLAGVVYVVNPFIYTRLMAGQYLILLGYALLPWLILSLIKLLEKPDWKQALYLAGWGFAIATVAIHDVAFIGLLGLIILLAWGWGRWRELGASAKWLGVAVVTWAVSCALWLIPLVMGRSPTAQQITSFDWTQFETYATVGNNVGVPLNTAALQGFFGDTAGRYALASSTGWLFWLAFVLIFALVVLGAWRSVVQRDRVGIAFIIIGILAWILAMGVAWGPVAGLNQWLVEYVPFYRGYREPHKWAAVLALAYAYLGAVGLSGLRGWLKGWPKDLATMVALMVPLLWVPMLLWGAGGQLRSVDYPAGWYQLNQRLNAEPGEFKVLMFPWHQYIALDFAGRTVAHPAPGFFDRPIITSTDPELPGVAATRTADNEVVEDDVLTGRFVGENAGAKLAPIGVRYVVLLKQSDWHRYRWLDRQEDIKLIEESKDWRLYRVEASK